MKKSRKRGAISGKFNGRQCKAAQWPGQFCIFLRAKDVRILKSLDCFSGKGKAKQMDTLKKILSNAEIVNIKYPEKVFTISFISQYFAFNVCSLAFPQAL